MRPAILIFPHQLFRHHPGFSKEREIFLVEEPLFFTGGRFPLKFHKKKLVLHRASMQAYQKKLESNGHRVHYIDFKTDLFQILCQKKVDEIWFADPVDSWLKDRLKKEAQKNRIKTHLFPSPGFLTPEDWIFSFFKEARHFSMTSFYIAQRKRLKILVENEKPTGGKWSFDPANRKKIPRDMAIPAMPSYESNPFVEEAKRYVEKHFHDNPGSTDDFIYPVTSEASKRWLKDFLKKKLKYFGDYQDAMMKDEPFLFHSVLTPMLNIGLLTPDQIVEETLIYTEKEPVPLSCLEGFLRQIIGWREFMRAVYLVKGEEERSTNFFQHSRKLPLSFYNGSTGLAPLDTVIHRLLQHAYVHHIERLMILGNIMLLGEIEPDKVYRWFMELFIDAYDWVMVPNVYGMSQHADGGLITTKPYISSSRYIRKMSDFAEGEWCRIWDGLYWRFIHYHRDFFKKHPRMKIMTDQIDRMGRQRLKQHLDIAESFLDQWGG